MLQREFSLKCDGCGKCSPKAPSEYEAHSVALAEAPHIRIVPLAGGKTRHLCIGCRTSPAAAEDPGKAFEALSEMPNGLKPVSATELLTPKRGRSDRSLLF